MLIRLICLLTFASLHSVAIPQTPSVAQVLPALAVETIELRDSSAYAKLVLEINETMKKQHGVPLFLRAYESPSLGNTTGHAFSLSPADSFAMLLKNRQTFASDPKLATLRERLTHQASQGHPTYLKAIRFDGANSPGWLFNTLIDASDDAALLRQVDLLQDLLTANGQPTAKINVFRVIAGYSEFSHLVSLNAASEDDLAKALDAIVASGWTVAGSPEVTVVRSALYQELQ